MGLFKTAQRWLASLGRRWRCAQTHRHVSAVAACWRCIGSWIASALWRRWT